MKSDLDLLRQFARENSQDAFGEIVRRHLDLVYSAALRQVRSPQLAEDVAQSVFADLARDARKLKPDTILTAWLYAVARRTAIDTVRRESRRQLREQIAVEMNHMNATANDWEQIAPLLDEAMAALDETDRAAILLRYFENKNLREVGEGLKISDDAAQKRVSRAVESLREFFSKQRLTIGAGGLAVLISTNAVQSAPIGLAATISAAAVMGTAVQTSALLTTTKTIAMTTLQKSIIISALTVVTGVAVYVAYQNSVLSGEIQMLKNRQLSLAAQDQDLQQERDDATNQLAGLIEENQQLQSDSNKLELLKLRGEAGLLRERNEELARALQNVENQNHPVFPTNFVSKDSWKFNGYDTPEDSIESTLWAKSVGNEQAFMNGTASENTNGVANWIQGKSDTDRSQFLINKTKGITGYQILSETPVADDEVLIQLEADSPANGQPGNSVAMEVMKQINGEWKIFDEYEDSSMWQPQQNEAGINRALGQ